MRRQLYRPSKVLYITGFEVLTLANTKDGTGDAILFCSWILNNTTTK